MKKGAETLEKAFELIGVSMFGYMTELDTVSINEEDEHCFEMEGENSRPFLDPCTETEQRRHRCRRPNSSVQVTTWTRYYSHFWTNYCFILVRKV